MIEKEEDNKNNSWNQERIAGKTCFNKHTKLNATLKKNDYSTWRLLKVCFNFSNIKWKLRFGFLAPIPLPLWALLLSWTPDHIVLSEFLYMHTYSVFIVPILLFLLNIIYVLDIGIRIYFYELHSMSVYVLLRNSHSIEIQSNDLPIFFYYTTVIKFYHFEFQSIMYLYCELNQKKKNKK